MFFFLLSFASSCATCYPSSSTGSTLWIYCLLRRQNSGVEKEQHAKQRSKPFDACPNFTISSTKIRTSTETSLYFSLSLNLSGLLPGYAKWGVYAAALLNLSTLTQRLLYTILIFIVPLARERLGRCANRLNNLFKSKCLLGAGRRT